MYKINYYYQYIFIIIRLILRKGIHFLKLKKIFYYPKRIKFLLSIINKEAKDSKDVMNYHFSRFQNLSVELASKNFDLKDSMSWHKKFIDIEDFNSLHRWSWLLKKTKNGDILSYETGMNLVYSWLNFYETKSSKQIDQTYNISERLCNFIFFHSYSGRNWNEIPKNIKNHLVLMLKKISNNLEVNSSHLTGNHILNNARALIIAGEILNKKIYSNLGLEILKIYIPQLITKDGFLKEGSSHYQFLVTRWILEIEIIVSKSKNIEILNFICNYIPNMVEACNIFIIKNNGYNSISLIGDISPDFTPEWLLDIPEYYNQILVGEHNNHNIKLHGWAHIASSIRETEKIVFKTNNHQKENYFYSEDSGFLKIKYGQWTLISHLEKNVHHEGSTHAHHDFLSFNIYLDSEELLINTGSFNYMNSVEGNYGKSSLSHNSVCINEQSPSLSKRDRFIPKVYRKKNFVIRKINNKKYFIIEIVHDGFSRLFNSKISHKRKIILSDRRLRISDIFYSTENIRVRISNHWPKKFRFLFDDKFKNKNNIIKKFIINKSSGAIEESNKYYLGSLEPFIGWRSKNYGKKEKCISHVSYFRLKSKGTISYNIELN